MGGGAQEGQGTFGADKLIGVGDHPVSCSSKTRGGEGKAPIPNLAAVLAKTVNHFFPDFPPLAGKCP
jgi:hypothetical protein